MAPILEVRGLSKRYHLGRSRDRHDTLRDVLHGWFTSPVVTWRRQTRLPGPETTFWALRDVEFDVARGEVVGVIGRNGAGKSTLLKILSRITDPTKGSVTLRGRAASLLEVGTGFHPELTGRENVFLNGAILGMRRAEILERFDAIVDFAEVRAFLDTPVKHYSSGMAVRLAFAVAAHLDPEILVVDEVLAVGDAAFQRRCLGRMRDVSRQEGRTVLLVSHNMAAVENLCRRALVLDRGRVVFDGPSKAAIDHYLAHTAGLAGDAEQVVDLTSPSFARRNPLLTRIELLAGDGAPVRAGVPLGSPLRFRVHFVLPILTESFDIGLGFHDSSGQRVFTAHTFFEPRRTTHARSGPQVFVCDIPHLTLIPGEYGIRVWLDVGNVQADLVDPAVRVHVLENDYYGSGKLPSTGMFVLEHHWYSDDLAAADGVHPRA